VTGALFGRDGSDVDALVTDRYLEALLSAHARSADRGPVPTAPADPIRSAADRLARDLPRLHPSFRFEEALAARLTDAAARMRLPLAVGADGADAADGLMLPLSGRAVVDDDDLTDGHSAIGRPWLIGGALTSAALSLAGAAYVAWRFNRPAGSPMGRAARAVARSRPV